MKKQIILYRGIAVDYPQVEKVISKIKGSGIRGDEGFWNFTGWDLRGNIESLLSKQNLTLKDTREGFREFPVVGYADELGAYYYALRHNFSKGKVPLIIKINVDTSKKYVYVDGRDFLCPVFQFWDSRNLSQIYGIRKAFRIASDALEQIYGEKIIKYFQKAAKSSNQFYRIAVCDLATHDIDITKEHLNNSVTIQGRGGVVFKSAFFVEMPLSPNEIKEIFIPKSTKYKFKPKIQIKEWL